MPSLALARETYYNLKVRASKRRRSINVDEHNDRLARARGLTNRRAIARAAQSYEPRLEAPEEPYYTLLTSPIGLDCE